MFYNVGKQFYKIILHEPDPSAKLSWQKLIFYNPKSYFIVNLNLGPGLAFATRTCL